jgi:acylpyruvate hydrolase
MKIICIGRNYVDHVHELNNAMPENPVVFLKPATALLKDNKPFFHPEWSKDIHYEMELVFRVSKQGKYISEKFAHKYVDSVSVGIDLTARDLQAYQKANGLPWEIAKAFDGAAILGNSFKSYGDGEALLKAAAEGIQFALVRNGVTVQDSTSNLMIYNLPRIISYVSQFITLQVGDLIYTGTPKGVAAIATGDRLEGYLEGEKLFDVEVK